MFPISLGVRVAVTTTSSIDLADAESTESWAKAMLDNIKESKRVKNFIYTDWIAKMYNPPMNFITELSENGKLTIYDERVTKGRMALDQYAS
jgi:hypothetical protein